MNNASAVPNNLGDLLAGMRAAEVRRIIEADYPSTGQLANLAAFRASDATAANGWRSSAFAWQLAAESPEAAKAYWDGLDEGDARSEIALALVSVGWTINKVWTVLS